MPTGVYKRKFPVWNKGKTNIYSEEYRRKISKALTGRIISEEVRERMSKGQKGKPATRGGFKEGNLYGWKGGVSFEEYTVDWTRTLRISIRERDNYTCQLCGKKQVDKTHAVHHIDYNKKNCNPENLITLCISCHMKTNHNRDKWIELFNKFK